MKKENKVATTIKLPPELYKEFKILGVRHKISLQTLVEKCVFLFVGDTQVSASFRELIYDYQTPKPISPEITLSEAYNPLPPQT